MRARVTPEDLAGSELVPVEWYGCEIVEYREIPAKSDQSANGIFTFRVIDGPKKGARASILVNEKAWAYNPNPALLVALGAENRPGVGLDVAISSDGREVKGKKLDVHIVRGTDQNGAEINKPANFAPYGKFSKKE